MANQKGTPRKIDAKLVDDRNKPIERRRVTDFLPAVNNSDLIKKFFAGSVDSLFQPEQTEKLSGFIGRIPQHAELEKEFYIDEPTKERTEYQLDPTAISTDPETGEIENILFYDDLPNLLRFSGGIVNNHDRLFETDFYSWCPPIDLDKLMNFTNYFWFETGPEVFRFTELTNAEGLIGTANPVSIQGINFVDELLVVFENDINILFRNRLFVVGGVGTSLTLTLVSTLESFVWDDIIGWDAGPWDGPDPQLSVGIDPDYIVMERGARDGNLWSIGNKWYHRDELNSTQLSIALERQAQRSIIEFKRDLELYNHGTFGRTPVTVRDDETTDPDVQIVGKLIPVTIDGIELNNGDTILFTQGPALSGVWDIQGWDFEDPSSITLINDDLLNPVPVTGTVVGPTTTIGDTIIINNVTVILTGTTLASTIIDINNASIEASAVILEVISVVVASDNGGALELNASIISLQEGNGTALTDLGLIEGTFGHPQLNQDEFDQNTTGGWDPFFNVAYSAVPGDITLFNIPPTPGQIFTSTGDFVALGFVPGMVIDIAGSTGQDGRYTIDTVISNTITLIEPFTGATGIGLPQPGNITITEFRRVFKNRIFKVSGVGSSTGITLELVADGQNEDGSPSDGDQVKVLLGIVHQNNVYYWSDAEDLWIEAQQKLTINQAPLFQLYDTVATQLQDPGKYPFSTFQGSKIFGYQINEDPRQPLDTVLEFPLKFNEFGEPTFENFLVTERVNFNNPVEEIIGYYFHRTIGDTAEQDFFSNDWYLSAIRSRQFLSNNFTADGTTQEFKLTLEPENLDEVEVFINGQQEQIEGWNIVGTTITFITEINKSDEIRIKYFSFENPPDDSTAVYEIPANLEGNPDNEEITFIANADFFKHFTEIIRRQIGFAGNANGSNNYRNTPRDRSLGTEILQHRAPMLKVMGLGSNINIDYIRSVRYVEREFSRFRNKFLKKVNEFFNDGIHTVTQPPSEWIEDALESINLGRVTEFPFAFSGMGTRISGEPTFIPSSPSRLGVYPVYTPQIFDDLTYQTPRKVIQFHDGSVIVAFNDFRDDVILELENNIFNAIPDEYKTEERPDFDWVDFVASQFRTGDYSITEFNKLLTPIIDRWAVTHVLNLTENTSFDITNPFSWNYGKQGLPGYWRGIFKLFYDTDRPNTHPWEILGFSQEPDWWAGRYGVAPFVATNTLLWNDVLSGQIAFGPRAGIDLRYLKPGVPIPVDGIGNLLDPVTLGLAKEPGLVDKQANWKIGDHGPVETVFRRSEFWSYAIAQISYLMKPARFIELGWEPDKQLFRYNNQEHPQWIDTSTEDRKRHSEYFVHGEELSDETIRRSNGIQQWITEFLVSIGKEVKSNFGDVIRTMQVRLGHRMAGFINPNSTRILADNFGLVPQEDIELQSYTNPSIREEFYGGVIIERVEKGWSVFGYDVLDPVFRVLPSINSNQRIVIEVSSIRVIEFKRFSPEPIVVPYNTVFTTQQEVYDFLIGYGRFLESNGWVFDEVDLDNNETNNWRLAGKQFLFWSLGRWAIGSLIAVSPSSQKVKFVTDQGTIQSVEQVINGVYGLLNKDGGVIQPRDTFVSRFEGEINITPNDEHSVYSSRLFIAETEHTLIFNNRTIFNDLIYNPLFKLRQSRFKLFTTRARGWKGRLDAPGFIVTEDNLIPNYEKTVNDFRRYFEIENGVERSVINDTARRLFGFQIRPYLDDLLFNRDTQFQFYQGFIRQKGTGLVLDKLLRSDISTEADNVQFFEEWALRLGEYGAVQDSITVEFLLREDEYRASPQLVEFKGSTINGPIPLTDIATSVILSDASTFPNSGLIRIEDEQITYTSKSINTLDGLTRGVNDTIAIEHSVGTLVGFVDVPFDDILVISNDDERWVIRPPEDGLVRFPFRNPSVAKRSKNAAYLFRTDIPSSGYPLETEVTFHVTDIEERDEIFDLQRITLEAEDLEFGDTIWVDNIRNFYDNSDPNSVFNFGFMVYRFTDTGLSFEIPKLSIGVGDRTLIITNLPHGFTKDQRIMIANNENTVPDLNGSYLVRFVTSVLGSGFTSPTEGETFVINDITITVDGTTITEVIETIDAAKVAGLLVYEDSSEIRLVNLEGDDIVLSEGPVIIGEIDATHITNDEIEINGVTVSLITGTALATGTPQPVYTPDDDIIINGTSVPLSENSVTGTVGSTYINGADVIINNIVVVLSTGTTVADAVIDITDAGILGITVIDSSGALKITGIIDFTLVDGSGGAFLSLGISTGSHSFVDQAISDINIAAISGITASKNGANAIQINSSSSFILAEGSGTALSNLGLIFGTVGVTSTLNDAVLDINAAEILNITAIVELNALRIDNTLGENIFLTNITGTPVDDLGLTTLGDIGHASGTITNNPTNMFSIANTITTDDNGGGDIGVFTESRFVNKEARNTAIINSTLGTFINWDIGEYTYVDDREESNDPVPLWSVYQKNSSATGPTVDGDWNVAQSDNVDRFQSLRVDTELFKQSLLYNKQTNITDAKLNIWDPAKGLFPGQALNDIDFKVEYDPAKYTSGDEEEFQIDPLEAWSELQVGQVWWDLSTTEYINYETGSNRERRNKWGRLTEGKSIDVYEWIRSSVPPTQWADLVENNADQPEESFRYKPSGEAFKVEETENPPFTQKIVRNEITGDDNINYYFWVKNSNTLPNIQNRDFTVSQITRQLTNPTSEGIPWWAPIDEHSLIFSGIEALLTRNDSVLQVNYDFTRNQNNLHREWILTREGDETQVPTDRFWNKMTDSLVGFNVENLPVPSPTLEESRKLGNFIRPRQTWFNDRESAGRIFIDCVNDQLRNICIVDEREDLFDSLFAKSPEPTEYIGSDPRLLCEYDFHVANNQERDLLPALSDLDQIWVDGTTETGGFWKVYQFNAEVFVEICSESFRLEDFWTQIDFFVEDVDPNIDPDITVETINDRNLLTNTGLTEGTVVRVNDSNSDGNETWSLFKFTPQDLFSPWVLIAKKDCTLEFNTDLFYNSDYGNPDVRTISKHFPEGISGNDQALKAFIEALRNDISTDLEENLLFFKMINYVHSEQLLVDWAFKTTYLFALGFNKAATQEPILRPDPTENFIEFIQEAKPYHTKLRDFITNQDFSLDIHETNITDFDKPVHFDNSLEEFRVLDSNDVDDKAIMALPDAAQNSWFNTFSTAPELIRSLTTTLLFDRVSCDLAGGWDPTFGWDFGPNEDWDLALSDVNETAAERIIKFYNPQPFTVEDLDTGNIDPIIDLTALISGCDFKGTIVDGKDFNILDIDVDTDLFGGEPSLAITSSIQVNYGNHSGLMLPVSVDSFAQGDGIINPIESIFIIGTSDGGPSVIPELITSVIVLVDNVIQIEGLLNDYTVSGDTLTFNVSSIPPANSGIQIVIAEFEIPFASTGNFRISLNTGSGRIEQNNPADFTEIGSRIVFVNPPSVGPAGSDLVEIFDNFVRIFPVPVGITAPISVSVNGILKTPGGSGFDYFDGGTFIEFQLESIPNHGEVVSIADDVTLLEAPTGAVDIIVDGNLFRQPDIDAGHPEELILNSVGEALAICVNSKERVNAPQVLTRRYVGFGVGPYPIDQIPASKDALWIYLNGVKQPFDDFDFDNVFNTISFTTATPGPNDIVVVTSFALGGGEESIILQEFAGNGIDDTFTLSVTPVSEGSVFVTVDGIVQTQGITKDYTINLAGPEIIFNFIPVNGVDIDVCIFASENFTSIKSTKHIVSSPLIAPASNTYALDQEIDSRDPIDFKDPNRLNDIANIFVSVNGVRQKPFSASEFGGWSTTSLPWSSSTWSSLNIDFDYIVRFNDGSGLEDQVVFPVKVLTDPNPVYNTGDSFSINETTVTLTGSTTIDVIHDINNTMIADILAMRDRSGTSIQIMNVVGGSIKLDNVSGTPLSDLGISGPFPKTIESVLSENDVVYISSMNNDYSIARELYDGVTNTFGMIQDVTIEDQIDLFINGIFVKRDPGPPNYTVDVSANTVTLTNDFLITAGITVGLNIGSLIEIVTYYTSTDTFTGDSTGNQAEYTISQVVDDVQKLFVSVNGIRQLAGIDYSIIGGDLIQFTRSHVDMDEIIITALTGPASAPKIAFRQFLNNFEAQQAQDLIQPFAISTLDDNILSTDLLITLVDRTGFPDQGIIIIGTDVGDTIEYEFVRYDGFDVNNKLIVIERGANNTTPADHFIGDIALILNPLIPQIANIEAHRISDDGKATLTQPLELGDTEIHLNRVAGLPKQPLGEKRLAKPGVIWIGTERIEFLERDGTILKQIIRGTKGTSSGVPAVYDLSGDLLSDVFTGGTLIYPVGTVVIDGSNKQRIPGGYEWEPAPFGLQFSNSSQARFLKNRPGSC